MQGQSYFNRMREFGKEFCGTPNPAARGYLAALTDYNPDAGEIHKECFCTAYVNAMVKEGLDFATSDNYKVVRNIKDADLDWALGYAIVQGANSITISNSKGWYFIVLAVVLILVLLGCYLVKQRYSGRLRRYKPLSQSEPNRASWTAVREKKAHTSAETTDEHVNRSGDLDL